MKRLPIIPIFLLIAGILLFGISCSKQSGPAGAPGATGSVGPAGQNGSMIYSGTTTPAGTLGNAGDFYLDLATSMLYGPKTASGWGTPISLLGSTGAAGTAGSQIYSGTTAPAATLGNTGDYYLDKTTYLLYGPKTASGWGTPIALQGPQGPEGNANVKVDTFSLTSSQWLWNSQYEFQINSYGSYIAYFTRYYDAAFSRVTQDILDEGMVLVYFTPNSGNANQWSPLPYQLTDASANFTYNIAFETKVGTVRLHYFFAQLSPTATIPTLSSYPIAPYKFKIVTVSGTISTSMKKAHVNHGNYMEVSKITGLWQSEKGRTVN